MPASTPAVTGSPAVQQNSGSSTSRSNKLPRCSKSNNSAREMADKRNDESTEWNMGFASANGMLAKCFASCDADPKGSVHRAWGLTLIFVVVYFIIAFVEMVNLKQMDGSKALMIASIWTGIVHLALAVLGTFVLKRFPTNFSIGFFLGILGVLINQNLIMFTTFHGYQFGSLAKNNAFANLALALSVVLLFFTLLLVNFRSSVVVAPIDAKGFSGAAVEAA